MPENVTPKTYYWLWPFVRIARDELGTMFACGRWRLRVSLTRMDQTR